MHEKPLGFGRMHKDKKKHIVFVLGKKKLNLNIFLNLFC
jgi:hypothetical protein